jgi:hypothetical protein
MKTLLLAATILAVSAPAAFAQCCAPGENLVVASNEPAIEQPADAAAVPSDEATPDATAAAATEPATGDQIDQQPITATDTGAEIPEESFND